VNEKTIVRGKQAHQHVYREVEELCEVRGALRTPVLLNEIPF
jgi:hypothetical protein